MNKASSHPLQFEKRFLLPQYWGIWFGVGLLWLIHLLPLNIQFSIGKALGKVMYFLAGKRRRLAAYNIQLAFENLSATEQKQLLQQHFQNLGLSIIETGIVWFGSQRRNPTDPKELQLISFKGETHLQAALEKNQGIILLVPHFTHIEMTGLFISMLMHFNPVYRPHNNALMDYLIKRGRALPRFNAETDNIEYANPIANSNTRQMLKVLKAGETMILLPDQRYRSKGKVVVPFFGHAAKSNPATSKIAQLTNALVIPTFTRRLDKFNYEIEFLPALEDFPGESKEQDTIRLHELYEREIRANPAQYLWVHNRWDVKRY